MSDWTIAETNTHQDHVIAHVLGATVLGYFVHDETAYLLLDIGFIWNIYLNGEMGLVPQAMAIAELDAEEAMKSQLREELDALTHAFKRATFLRFTVSAVSTPIQSVEFAERGSERRLSLICEDETLVIETSLASGEVRIREERFCP